MLTRSCLCQLLLLATLLFATMPADPSHGAESNLLNVKVERAFPNLRFDLPVVITNAADGTDRLFVAAQKGKIHVFPRDPAVTQTETFLDIESRVTYKDRENEEGLLGLAFHPKYKQNGQFIVYYTTRDAPHTSVISRFRVSKDDPNRADADSEEELLRIKQPFWNHNGGTVEFGPDGFLYIGLGDGGMRDDPFGNGQNLTTLHGSILRIDVDHNDPGMAYAIPQDNPFVDTVVTVDGQEKQARGEIWAHGLRNVWRLTFDRETGTLWAADVGQDIWEEVNIIQRGGNYGWNLREGRHRFRAQGAEASKNLIEPIWEYHHEIGKSITGGMVYRGSRLPELRGAYLCADYVSGKLWALRYDEERKDLTDVNSIPTQNNPPIVTFGEDEAGEVYFSTNFGMLFQLVPAGE